ncbi:hypothetical protein [Alteromonas sp. C1M14]|uniref:hypothetical protein n=1 Tax=Alteromonas sp. C1M14 TaxID=2841567 RepID=UPI001C082651|nr:hypothetical protein [Alteromonas sp. C1M14]MBU2977892.1 hypothetical protein [Alteromonas sp. C1M14]
MLNRLNHELSLNTDSWTAFKLVSSVGDLHYRIFSCINNRTFWSKRIDLKKNILVVENGFILQNNPRISLYLEALKEGRVQRNLEVEMERTLSDVRAQWARVEKVKMKEELKNYKSSFLKYSDG